VRPTPHPIDVRRAGGGYDAFLSYAWDPAEGRAGPAVPDAVSDAVVARRLRFAMQDLGKPRTRRTDLAIFLDRSVQTPSPDLWRGILDNLDRSRFLIVLCSPRSAASDGVAREAQHWLDTGRSLDDLLVVLLSGSAAEALPPPLQRLREAGAYDPLFVDLRWVRSARDLDSRTSSRFREDVATLLAPIRGVAKETLVDEELTVRERSIRVQRRFITGLSVAVVVALVLGLAATLQWRRADDQARIAESRALAASAENQLATHLDVAQLLAVEGFRRDDNLETRATLLRATLASPSLVRYLDAGAPVSVLTAASDGNTVVVGTDTGRVRKWTLAAAAPASRELDGFTRRVAAVAAAADGGTVSATDGTSVLVWRGDRPGQPVPVAERPGAVGLSPSGRWLTVAEPDPAEKGRSVLEVVDVIGGTPTRRFPLALDVATLVVSGEDEILAISDGGLWQRLQPSTGAASAVSPDGQAGVHVYAAAVSPDGNFFAWTNGDTKIPVYRLDRPANPDTPDFAAEAPGRSPEAVAVAPGGRLAAVADSGAITVSRTRSPTGPAGGTVTLTGNTAISQLRFLDGSRRLASASGNSVALWDFGQLARPSRWGPTVLPYACNACKGPAVAVSPDGAFAALAPQGGVFVSVTGMPTGADAPSQVPAVLTGGITGDVEALRWTDAHTLEVTVSEPTQLELRDGGTSKPVVAAAAVAATNTATLRGSGPVTLVVRVAPATDDLEAAARSRAQAVLDAAWATVPHGEYDQPGPIALAPDHTAAAAIAEGNVLLMVLGDGGTTTLPVGDAQDVALTADRLLVSRASGPVEIRDRTTHAIVATVPGAATAEGVLVTSPDGGLAARLRRDGTVEVIDVARAGVLGVLDSPTQISYGFRPGLAFTADGTALLIARPENDYHPGSAALHVYDLSPDRLLPVACATAGRDLTPDEWRQFVNDAVPTDLHCTRA